MLFLKRRKKRKNPPLSRQETAVLACYGPSGDWLCAKPLGHEGNCLPARIPECG
jgi:hypothetical protein